MRILVIEDDLEAQRYLLTSDANAIVAEAILSDIGNP